MSQLSPIKLAPVFKDYLWGGTKLKTEFDKKTDLDIVAESWELSAHKDGQSVVKGGEYEGLTLSDYVQKEGKEVLGTKAEKFSYFPILIKLIDAKGDLSVQVHPDDKYALEKEGEYGKTEMWYILDCEKGACLYYGFCKDVSKEEYEQAIKENTLTDILNKVEVHKGDVFFIPSGTVHAIGAGIVICEIQQNSNTTYRVYDYNRRDKDGNLRPLHVEKALEVSSLKKSPDLPQIPDEEDVLLSECEYFNVRRLRVKDEAKLLVTKESFCSLIVTEGSGTLSLGDNSIDFAKGDSIFVPAQNADVSIKGKCELIVSRI